MLVGYYGGKAHQPRLLGFSIVSMGLGTLTMALAHFTAPPYNPASISLLCDLNRKFYSFKGMCIPGNTFDAHTYKIIMANFPFNYTF